MLGTIKQNDGSVAVMDAHGDRVGRIDGGVNRNAHLIAAAPDLYEALVSAVRHIERVQNLTPANEGPNRIALMRTDWYTDLLAAREALAKVSE